MSPGPNVFGVHLIGWTTKLSLVGSTVVCVGAVQTTVSEAATATVSRRVIATCSAGAAAVSARSALEPGVQAAANTVTTVPFTIDKIFLRMRQSPLTG